MATTTESAESNPAHGRTDEFGPNEWLIEEMYVRYQADPSSVDPAWHEFFADYAPPGAPGAGGAGNGAAAPAPAVPAAPSAPPAATPAAPVPAASPAAAAPAPAPAAPAPVDAAAAGPAPVIDERPATAMLSAGLPTDGPVDLIADEARDSTLRGAAARVVANMESSLAIPTATSVRSVPAKALVDNRTVINNHLRRARGGKVSYTHVIGYAVVRATAEMPEMNRSFALADGKPTIHQPGNVNLGLAIDLEGRDGTRSLVVAAIKVAEKMDFNQFWSSYEDIVRRARANALTPDDFAGTTISLTNPGGIGTVHSVPRLMQGQGAIIGVGAMEYPAEFAGMSEEALSNLAVGKILTLTSTYDHRIIQGAQSGEFLRRVEELLRGADGFYDEIFASLRIPYEPVRWLSDRAFTHEGQIDKGARVIELITAYRTNGHLMADTDPLVYTVRTHPDLDIISHGLTLWDLDREFAVGGFGGKSLMKLRDILGLLRDAYCRRIGVEYMHIADPAQRAWLQERLEVAAEPLPREEQKHILGRLNVAEAFETFLQTKYVGQTRFSLEGGETVIPLLDAILQRSADYDLDEVAIGMPHRGRLNVLANIIGKPYETIFGEFEGNMDPASVQGSGDVKYHLGDEGTFTSINGKSVLVTMTANPSHLEAVDPVIEGIVRAKQDVVNRGEDGFTVMPLLMHGDAAFSGQGIVAETLNLSQLRGFRTGGTIHVVVNNQLGFTTGPAEGRSSTYCTDVARMISAPIFHVNGDDPEACVRVAKLAVEYRQQFKRDVVIDMICYRRRGHNEADNPSFTQPVMYDIIDAKRSVRKLFTEVLIGRGDITVEEAEEALRDFQQQLEKVFNETRNATGLPTPEPAMDPAPTSKPLVTAASLDTIKRIGDAYSTLPDGFTIHPRLKPQIDRRVAMSSSGNVDWATAELYAFGATVLDGKAVRLTGQDSRRGTFTQRHAVLIDRLDGGEYTPLRNLAADQEQFWVYDSVLSEYAVMGFEYGYSVARSDALVCWEAQYGDFADGAQTIIDEFISSGEAKWGQRSAVTLLLPHGYEGQGPDHSTGRPERFLQLAAESNMTIAMCSTPASYFHLLRRQALSEIRRPLVVFTPKSLLRHKAAVSALADFTEGSFEPVIGDPSADPAAVTRVLMCSGKVYYDLAAKRAADGRSDVAIVRVEQLYPLPVAELQDELARFPQADLVWVQEEPANQGAWQYMALNLPDWIDRRVRRASRPAAASPAAGASSTSEKEQRALIEDAFA